MADTEYTPTTDEVRETWGATRSNEVRNGELDTRGVPEAESEFDRWRAQFEREVAERTWDEAVEETHALGWLHDFAKSDALARNPYRADRIEKGEVK